MAGLSSAMRKNLFFMIEQRRKDGHGDRKVSECGEGKELRQFMPRSRRIPKGKLYTGSNLLAGPGMGGASAPA